MVNAINLPIERETKSQHLGGIILSGGRSRRMNGEVKALLPLNGVPTIKRIAIEMNQLCSSVAVSVANSEQAELYNNLGFSVVIDDNPDCGPLSALHSALKKVVKPFVWVSACDMPLASYIAADWMVNKLEASGAIAVIPEIGGRLHPLQAVYRRDCIKITKVLTESGECRMFKLLDKLDHLVMTEDDCIEAGVDVNFVYNVNTPDQYKQLVSVYNT